MNKLTKEQLLALAQCADVKALLAKLTEMGVTCSEEDAKKLFDKMHTAELSDEELDNVAGGGVLGTLWSKVSNVGVTILTSAPGISSSIPNNLTPNP